MFHLPDVINQAINPAHYAQYNYQRCDADSRTIIKLTLCNILACEFGDNYNIVFNLILI